MARYILGHATLKHWPYIHQYKFSVLTWNLSLFAISHQFTVHSCPDEIHETPREHNCYFFQFPSNCGIPQYESLPHQSPFFPSLFDSPPLWWGFGRKRDSAGAVGGSGALSFGLQTGTRGWFGSSQRRGRPPPDPLVQKYFLNNGVRNLDGQRGRGFLLIPILFFNFLPLQRRHLVLFAWLRQQNRHTMFGQRKSAEHV